ncbi:MAG TPA: hypothetical protein VHA14_05385 [Bryobacteraceae bacterium]|nr:hypothetical protein [Bryobacteraceae bacterium]
MHILSGPDILILLGAGMIVFVTVMLSRDWCCVSETGSLQLKRQLKSRVRWQGTQP